jgi:hypothetical protein
VHQTAQIWQIKGLWRYRLMLKDSKFLEMFEFFKIESGQVEIHRFPPL